MYVASFGKEEKVLFVGLVLTVDFDMRLVQPSRQ